MTGYIHSTESFGTVDGPGIRFVIFMQGCPLRCKYCHNPDTWELRQGTEMTSDELIALYLKNKAFYSKGGITVTGGEPLLQIDFLLELFAKAKDLGIHTCIDTSGITYSPDNESYNKKLSELMKLTNLVMLDIKHIDNDKHKELTGHYNKGILAFAEFVDSMGVEICIRHVVVEGITDKKDDLINLGKFIGTLRHLRYLDVLPYHTMGVNKYRDLGLEYPLEGIQPTSQVKAAECKNHILQGIREIRIK
jgi:pyruvate formate lyase activating enzyme